MVSDEARDPDQEGSEGIRFAGGPGLQVEATGVVPEAARGRVEAPEKSGVGGEGDAGVE